MWPSLECQTLAPVGVNTARANSTRMDPNVSCLDQRFIGTPYSNVEPAMIGNYAAAERITKFSLLPLWEEGHFIRDCDARGNCLHISEEALDCEDGDHDRCECKCGQHRHFMNAGDREAAMLAILPPKAQPRKSCWPLWIRLIIGMCI